VQPEPGGLAQAYQIGAQFIGSSPSCLILGDNLFYGAGLTSVLEKASQQISGATIFAYRVADPSAYGVVELDNQGRPISLEEKPIHPKSAYAVPGLYFYDEKAVAFASQLKPSKRGELEITDLNRCYLERGTLQIQLLGRGTAWLDTGTHDSLFDATEYVQVIQRRQGLKIACLEEIAYERNWLSREQVHAQAVLHESSSYGDYLKSIIERDHLDAEG
jgi:glucose-1-phosphate thymidylyltransferase